MNENTTKLVEALRSGDYKQGQGLLRPREDQFCCLGVACDISGLGEWQKSYVGSVYVYVTATGSGLVLPKEVMEWLGWATNEGYIDEETSLAALNDHGDSFEAIADVIEANFDKMVNQ